jgi:hypothetical protein
MLKLYLFFFLTVWIISQSDTAWSETVSQVFQIGVTLPQTITMAPAEQNRSAVMQRLNVKSSQMVLEQNMSRNHRTVLVRSIVAR